MHIVTQYVTAVLAGGQADQLTPEEEATLIPSWVTISDGFWRREDGSGFSEEDCFLQGAHVRVGWLSPGQWVAMIPALTFYSQTERMPRPLSEEEGE